MDIVETGAPVLNPYQLAAALEDFEARNRGNTGHTRFAANVSPGVRLGGRLEVRDIVRRYAAFTAFGCLVPRYAFLGVEAWRGAGYSLPSFEQSYFEIEGLEEMPLSYVLLGNEWPGRS